MNEHALDLQPLPDEEIQHKLVEVPGWTYQNNKITKQFKLKSFTEVVNFILTLTPYFNSHDHHPDIYINYKKVVFSLHRFSAGGKVTERDFMVAKKIEAEFENTRF